MDIEKQAGLRISLNQGDDLGLGHQAGVMDTT